MLSHRITKFLLFTAVLAIIFLPTFASIAAEPPESKVVATVNGNDILESTLSLYQQRRGIPRDADPQQQRKMMLEELINMELLYQDALKTGADKTPAFTKAFAQEMEHLKRNMLASFMIKQHAETSVLTDEEMKKEYDKHKTEMARTEYKARHILLETEKDAKDIVKQLNKGADFAELAKAKSTGPSATHGGDLGWFEGKQMVKAFSDAVAALEKGKYTTSPVRTQFGWHVILKEDQRIVDPPPFESMKEQLRMRLKNKLVENYIGDLRKDAKIERK
jgi:peptidyl-prolyl cis-trans isomerase C